ncbi:MAG: protein-L-isoaspartate(D-aspartate) O-methyltransferase [Gammaproteobacteria bacterium]|nr:protein-L-isoaspartate(D-aspartate) O-methyltransferase [Gammaproteobacteria bacterium]
MIAEIMEMTRYSEDYTGVSAIDSAVLEAMREIDRSAYVPKESRAFAFANRPLGIGHGQTISQPFIVALMTHLLNVQGTDTVLEIGTGSGYQTAVLAKLAAEVYTIEIVEALAKSAAALLQERGFANVSIRTGDGWFGWEEHSPFDKIMVTAVAPKLPPKLVDQIKVGGVMVLPVGEYDGYQELMLVKKVSDTDIEQRIVLPVRFVPMTGEAAQYD